MAKIMIQPAAAKTAAEKEYGLVRDLNRIAQEVDSVRTGLRYKIAGREQIAARLREAAAQIRLESRRTGDMKTGLDQIIRLYTKTETANRDSLAGTKKPSWADIVSGNGITGGTPVTPEEEKKQKNFWDYLFDFGKKELSNLLGPLAFLLNGTEKLLEDSDLPDLAYWNEVLKGIGKVVKANGDTTTDWFKSLFGLTVPAEKAGFWETFGKKLGDFSDTGKGVSTVVSWATSFIDRMIKNYSEFDGNWGSERMWRETINETLLKIGEGALIGAGVAALCPATWVPLAVGAATVGVTFLVDLGLDSLTGWITNGQKTDWIDALSDLAIDAEEWMKENVGPVIKKGIDYAAEKGREAIDRAGQVIDSAIDKAGEAIDKAGDALEKTGEKIKEGWDSFTDGVSNMFSGINWGRALAW